MLMRIRYLAVQSALSQQPIRGICDERRGPRGDNMRSLSFVVALVAAVASIGSARAQTYPARPITLIVPFAAGGAVDITARIVGEHMSRTLGQQLVIENVVGAGGTIASARTMRASPDGYTVMVGHLGTHAFAVALYPNLPYRPDVDFQPIGQVATNPLLIAARRDFPASDLKEFITFVKTRASSTCRMRALARYFSRPASW